MNSISSIQSIDMTNISYILATNYSGVEVSYQPSDPNNRINLENSFLTLSTLTTFDISGASSLYMVDISGAHAIMDMSTVRTTYTPEPEPAPAPEPAPKAEPTAAINIEVNISDIINSRSVFLEIEQQNKTNLTSLDFSVFKTLLYKWAALNFPDSFLAYSFPVTTPPITNGLYSCSDGNHKNIWDYIPYCLGMSIQELITGYQTKVSGIALSFSVNADPYVLNIHVTRSN